MTVMGVLRWACSVVTIEENGIVQIVDILRVLVLDQQLADS